MKYPQPITEIMRGPVAKVEEILLPQLQQANSAILGIRYEYGHPAEIIDTLRELTKDPGTKENGFTDKGEATMWPAIFLFTDIGNEYGSSFTYPDFRLNMVLAMSTTRELKAAQRQAQNFDTILTPIYHELMKQIDRSIYIKTQSQRQIKHTATDRMYWGKNGIFGKEGNQFNDLIDAIEITNLQLSLYP